MNQNEHNANDDGYNVQVLAKDNPADGQFYEELSNVQDMQRTQLKKLVTKTLQIRFTTNCVMQDLLRLKEQIEGLNKAVEAFMDAQDAEH